MKPVERKDICSPEEYAKIRPEFRARVMAIKDRRRVSVGPYLTFLFENRDTVIYQVQEMVRAEKIHDERAVQHEIDTYNQLLPGDDELKATLLIEFDDPVVRAVKLKELLGLERHVSLVFGENTVQALFDEEQMDSRRLSSVQYVCFPLAKAAPAFATAKLVELVTTHPGCSFRQALSGDQLAALRER